MLLLVLNYRAVYTGFDSCTKVILNDGRRVKIKSKTELLALDPTGGSWKAIIDDHQRQDKTRRDLASFKMTVDKNSNSSKSMQPSSPMKH